MPYYTEQSLLDMGFGRIGRNVKISDKAAIYHPERIELGNDVRIDDFCVLSGRIVLGSNVHIAVFCNIAGGEMGVTFEDFSGLAYGAHVFSQSDDYSGKSLPGPLVPEKYKQVTKKPVLVRKHSIVGACSLVFPGVVLEVGTAVGAMSMVTKSTEPWSVYFGIPAKKVKDRRKDMLALEQAYLEERDREAHKL